MNVKSLYDELCEAVEDKGAARKAVLDVAREVGVDIFSDVEGGHPWSHANMLRVVRAVRAVKAAA